MNWYVRHEGTEEISGPMTKEEALDKAGQVEGMVFDENIFSPKIENFSEKVATLCGELQGIREAKEIIRQGEDDSIGLVLQHSIEALSNLSREKVVIGTIQGGVLSLDEVSEGVLVDIRDYDTEGMDEDNLGDDETGFYFQAGRD